MTNIDVIEMAIESELIYNEEGWCGWVEDTDLRPFIKRFAALVAAASARVEREACAKVCEPKSPRPCDCDFCDCGNSDDKAAVADWDASSVLAIAIRARGETK